MKKKFLRFKFELKVFVKLFYIIFLASCQKDMFNNSGTNNLYKKNMEKHLIESQAIWNFTIKNNGCYANLSTNYEEVRIYSESNGFINFSISGNAIHSIMTRGKYPAYLIFSGAYGSWKLPMNRASSESLATKVKPSKKTDDNILSILGGGVLRAQLADGAMHILHVPDSNVAGREWFSCIKSKISS
jgi:hypothetical protein